jgi:serine/threonine protein kinase
MTSARESSFANRSTQSSRPSSVTSIKTSAIGSFVDVRKRDGEYCLVYELCENGNVLERLGCRNHKLQKVPALTAEQRLDIALGTCRALEYLHVKVVILCSYCTHTVLILYSYCTHCTHCTHTLLILYSHCTHLKALPPIVHRDVKSANSE